MTVKYFVYCSRCRKVTNLADAVFDVATERYACKPCLAAGVAVQE